MKKTVALLLCGVFVFLCSCNKEEKNTEPTTNNNQYVNVDDYTGIPRVTQTDWFNETTTKKGSQSVETTGTGVPAVKADLPEGFPDIPEGTSNISIIKYKPEDSEAGYRSDWIRLKFSAPMHSIIQFSNDLTAAGYKGSAKYVESHDGYYEYYVEGWQGGWQNGEHIIRIITWENEIDGSYAITMDIVECSETFYPELEQYFPAFEGYSIAPGRYYEILSDGTLKKDEFDGRFHQKWQIRYSYEESFTGVTRQEFEDYVEKMKSCGLEGEAYYYRLDGCSVYGYDGVDKEKDLYTSFFYNETLSTLEIVFTNDGTNFIVQ